MATPGELVRVIAVTTGEDIATVTQHDRNLVTAGLRSKGGRGTSAAKVTPRDAANLLTAVVGSYRVKESVETVHRYTQTQEGSAWWNKHFPDKKPEGNVWANCGIPELALLPPTHSFVDLLETLIRLASEGALAGRVYDFPLMFNSSIRITMLYPHTHGRIEIIVPKAADYPSFSRIQADYQPNEAPAEWVVDPSKPISDEERRAAADEPSAIKRTAEIKHEPIIWIGALLSGAFEGSDDEGWPLNVAHPSNIDLPPAERVKRFREIAEYVLKREARWKESKS